MVKFPAIIQSLTIAALYVTPGLVGAQGAERLLNPIAAGDFQQLLVGIVAIVLVLAIPIVVFYLIYAGFLLVAARGNQQMLDQGKRMLIYGIVGGTIIISGYAILAIIDDTVTSF